MTLTDYIIHTTECSNHTLNLTIFQQHCGIPYIWTFNTIQIQIYQSIYLWLWNVAELWVYWYVSSLFLSCSDECIRKAGSNVTTLPYCTIVAPQNYILQGKDCLTSSALGFIHATWSPWYYLDLLTISYNMSLWPIPKISMTYFMLCDEIVWGHMGMDLAVAK